MVIDFGDKLSYVFIFIWVDYKFFGRIVVEEKIYYVIIRIMFMIVYVVNFFSVFCYNS